MKKAIGIDLGGTAIKGVLMDEGGCCGDVSRVPTEAFKGGRHVLDNIVRLIGDLIDGAGGKPEDFIGIGIGVPGFVDGDGVVVGGGEQIAGWKGTGIYAPIMERFGLKAVAVNDVTAVALAEQRFGAGRGVENLVCFALGTGVGGGIVVNGKLYQGRHGMAGEIGHIVVETDGVLCNCGQKGCVERYASATGIVNMAVEMSTAILPDSADDTPFAQLVRRNPANVTSKTVYEYVAKADPLAIRVHNKACDMLGRAVGILINTLSPDRVVLGGGVMMAGDVILKAVKSYAARHCWPAIFENCEIVRAEMGEDAGVMGAGALAFDEFGN